MNKKLWEMWEQLGELLFAFWLGFIIFGIGAVAILDWMGVPLLPNILIVSTGIAAAGWVEVQFIKLRHSCPSCRQEWHFTQGAFICDHCGLRAERPRSN